MEYIQLCYKQYILNPTYYFFFTCMAILLSPRLAEVFTRECTIVHFGIDHPDHQAFHHQTHPPIFYPVHFPVISPPNDGCLACQNTSFNGVCVLLSMYTIKSDGSTTILLYFIRPWFGALLCCFSLSHPHFTAWTGPCTFLLQSGQTYPASVAGRPRTSPRWQRNTSMAPVTRDQGTGPSH